MNQDKFFRAIKFLLGIKICFLLVRAFGPFAHPHIIRQTDTMGVSIRYFSRWFIEGDLSFLPAVLTSGDGRGIQSMELPIYNMIFAPIFALDLTLARGIAQLLSLGLMLGLTYWASKVWKDKKVAGIEVKNAFLLMLLIGTSSVFFYRFMPDYLAFIFVMVGLGLSLDDSKKYPLSFLLTALGLMIKPTAVIALGPLLILKPWRQLLKPILAWVIPALAITALYYTKGMKYLRSQSNLEEYFYTAFRNPIQEIINFLSEPAQIFDLFANSFFGHMMGYVVLIFLIWNIYKTKKISISPLLFIFLLQLVSIMALDGSHTFIHDYYFVGTSFVIALFYVVIIERSPPWMLSILLAVLFATTIEKSLYQVYPLFKKNLYAECAELKSRHPEFPWRKGYIFRSIQGHVPYDGLCFGERQASLVSQYGFYKKTDSIPNECIAIDETKNYSLVKCQ